MLLHRRSLKCRFTNLSVLHAVMFSRRLSGSLKRDWLLNALPARGPISNVCFLHFPGAAPILRAHRPALRLEGSLAENNRKSRQAAGRQGNLRWIGAFIFSWAEWYCGSLSTSGFCLNSVSQPECPAHADQVIPLQKHRTKDRTWHSRRFYPGFPGFNMSALTIQQIQ